MQKNFKHIFSLALKQDRLAQKSIYEIFSGRMLAVAKSYVNSREDAEDVLVTAFCKAFSRIGECSDEKSFPFWLRKIVVNDSITFIRKNKNILYYDAGNVEEIGNEILDEDENNFPNFDVENVLAKMPLGYKLVFNLYIFEDKKHQEIAGILNISEGTSKSQLNKAKKWLVEFFNQNENEKFIKK